MKITMETEDIFLAERLNKVDILNIFISLI